MENRFIVDLVIPEPHGIGHEDVHVNSRGGKITLDCLRDTLIIFNPFLAENVRRRGLEALEGVRLNVVKKTEGIPQIWVGTPTQEHGGHFLVVWDNYIQLKIK